jgi:hypothetical protein
MLRNNALLLPALALSAGLAAVPARAQDTLEAPAAVAEAPAPRSEGGRIAVRGTHVQAGQVIDGDVVAAFGDVRVDGEVKGDVTVGRGDLVLGPQGTIHGDAVVNGGGRLLNEGGRVFGEMRVNSEAEAQAEAGATVVDADDRAKQVVRIRNRGWLGRAGEGVGDVFSTLAIGLVLAALGAGLVFYARPQLETVSAMVRRSPARSGGVGFAGLFLSPAALLVGMMALIFTLVGIPLLLLYFPLFFLAMAAAGAYGVVAVAHAIGERTAEQGGSFETRHRNAYSYVFSGLVLLLAPKVAGHVVEILPFIGWVGSTVAFLGTALLWMAAIVGFGAVILTRAGTRPDWPWNRAPAFDPVFDRDPFADERFDERPAGGGAHV